MGSLFLEFFFNFSPFWIAQIICWAESRETNIYGKLSFLLSLSSSLSPFSSFLRGYSHRIAWFIWRADHLLSFLLYSLWKIQISRIFITILINRYTCARVQTQVSVYFFSFLPLKVYCTSWRWCICECVAIQSTEEKKLR